MASKPNEITATDSVFAPFKLAWHLLWSILTIWALSVAIHIGWIRWHHIDGKEHMQQLIGYYVDLAGKNAGFVEEIADKGFWLVFEATHAQRLLSQPPTMATRNYPSTDVGTATRRGLWATFQPDMVIAGYATILFGIKLGMVAIALVIFALVMISAGTDGLVQRYIRRACGGYESAAIYHRAKLYGWRMLPPLAATLFFCSPVSFDPVWIFFPTLLISALLIRLQLTYYKKYL